MDRVLGELCDASAAFAVKIFNRKGRKVRKEIPSTEPGTSQHVL